MFKSDLKPVWVTESPRSKAVISHLLATSKQVVEKIRNLEANWIIHQRKTISWPFFLPKPTVPKCKDPNWMQTVQRGGMEVQLNQRACWTRSLPRSVLGAARIWTKHRMRVLSEKYSLLVGKARMAHSTTAMQGQNSVVNWVIQSDVRWDFKGEKEQ